MSKSKHERDVACSDRFGSVLEGAGVAPFVRRRPRGEAEDSTVVIPRRFLTDGLGVADPVLWWGGEMTGGEDYDNDDAESTYSYSGCLDAFCRLHNGNGKDILKFARRWGVLGLWPLERRVTAGTVDEEGGVILGDLDWAKYPTLAATMDAPVPLPSLDYATFTGDRVEFWKTMARQFRAILQVHAALVSRQRPDTEPWHELFGTSYRESVDKSFYHNKGTLDADLRVVSAYLRVAVESLTDLVPLSIRMWWSQGEPAARMRFDYAETGRNRDTLEYVWVPTGDPEGGGWQKDIPRLMACLRSGWGADWYEGPPPPKPSPLFHALVLQLASALTSNAGFLLCDKCGQWFSRERTVNGKTSIYKTKLGRPNLCLDCQKKAASEYVKRSRAKTAAMPSAQNG